MKSFFLLSFFILFFLSAGAQDIDILTFNIRYASFNQDAENWDDRKEGVIALIRNHDFIGLQEVLPVQMEDINLELYDEYGVLFRTRDSDPLQGEGSPVMYNKKRWAVISSGFLWLSDTPDIPGSNTWGAAFNRMASFGYFRENLTGDSILVVNTHFDHISQSAREKSVELILGKFKEPANQMPFIFMGDLNVTPDNPVHSGIISGTGLSDSWFTLHGNEGISGASFHGWKPDEPVNRIDYIFYSPRLKAVKSEVLNDKFNGSYPSDHFPVNSIFTRQMNENLPKK